MTTHAPTVGPEIARDFVARSFHPDDWVALFGKAYDSRRVLQWVTPVATVCERRWLTWLQVMNAYRFNVYVSVNAMTPGQRHRTKAAVEAVRHLFLDVDHDGPNALQCLMSRSDVPVPSYVVHSSPGRMQILWRVEGFQPAAAERLQKNLAREFGGDRAATAVTQTMRVPGFLNHKYTPPPLVAVEYRAEGVFGPGAFPAPAPERNEAGIPVGAARVGHLDSSPDAVARATRYLAAVPPAVAGQGGDLQTFRLCCRLVRGFALDADVALGLLAEWNARCEPPWTERELMDKLEHARRYGREPVGGLLRAPPP